MPDIGQRGSFLPGIRGAPICARMMRSAGRLRNLRLSISNGMEPFQTVWNWTAVKCGRGAQCAVLQRRHRAAFSDPNPAFFPGGIDMIRSLPNGMAAQEI